MTKEEAASLIEIIAGSLRDNPFQFQLNASVAGVQGPMGGCREYSVYIQGDIELNVNVAQEAATRAITEQMQAAITSLDTIVTQLRSTPPDKGIISNCLRTLRGNWLPAVITSVVANLISATLGIGTVG